jgi:hypothetical protein
MSQLTSQHLNQARKKGRASGIDEERKNSRKNKEAFATFA